VKQTQLIWPDSFPSLLWCNTALFLCVIKLSRSLTSVKEKEVLIGVDYRRFRPTGLSDV